MRVSRLLALLLAISAATPVVAAAPVATAPTTEGSPKAAQSPISHVVQVGETIYSVAKKYDISAESLMRANGITDPAKLKTGQRLLIPAMHKVKKGETLYSIARSYGLKVEDLRAANKLSAQSLIKVGDILVLPGQAALPSIEAPKAPDSPDKPARVSPPLPLAVAPTLPPPAIRTAAKPIDKKTSWPCAGEVAYLDGKAQGVIIHSRIGEVQKAVAAGKVVASGPFRGYGQMAIVISRTGHLYVYAGNESLSVKVGDTVRSGQELGRVGMDAKEGKPIAFFMVYHGREAIDPADAPRD